jgi:16S rRNA (cytosine1402-N4)-methyltransferase
MNYHNPVLLKESISALVYDPDGVYVDCTFGGGGHSKEILRCLSENGKLFAFDQDQEALHNKIDDTRFLLINQNFSYLKNELRINGISSVGGILADLGVSSHQFDTPERGFSTRFDSELDMRMNKKSSLTAKIILNNYTEEQLNFIFKNYAEISNYKKITSKIIQQREISSIKTTEDLKNIFKNDIPSGFQNKFYAKLFQGLRIEVNDELSVLKDLLKQAAEMVCKGGVVVFISYHSLEDKLVKHFLKYGLFEGMPERDLYGNWTSPFRPTQSKVIVPTEEEIKLNTRARSAKMRIASKT